MHSAKDTAFKLQRGITVTPPPVNERQPSWRMRPIRPISALIIGQQPEGVAYDADRQRLWVAGEPNELMLYAAALEDCGALAGATGGAAPPSSAPSLPHPSPPPPCAAAAATAAASDSLVRINEVVDASCAVGCGDLQCGGQDWVELYNGGERPAFLGNFTLADDHGPIDPDAYHFSTGGGGDGGSGVYPPLAPTMAPGTFLVLCKIRDFQFGIGHSDTVSLWNADGALVDSAKLSGHGEAGVSFARDTDGVGDGAHSRAPFHLEK